MTTPDEQARTLREAVARQRAAQEAAQGVAAGLAAQRAQESESVLDSDREQ